jgi:hypothetical protein
MPDLMNGLESMGRRGIAPPARWREEERQ